MDLRASTPQPPMKTVKTATQPKRQRTFFPSKKKQNVGVAVTPCSRATIELIPTLKSTLTNAIPLPVVDLFFDRARSSNTGSIILHGAHVAEVNIAMTARWVLNRLRNDDGFVEGWIEPLTLDAAAAALVEGVL